MAGNLLLSGNKMHVQGRGLEFFWTLAAFQLSLSFRSSFPPLTFFLLGLFFVTHVFYWKSLKKQKNVQNTIQARVEHRTTNVTIMIELGLISPYYMCLILSTKRLYKVTITAALTIVLPVI